MEILKWVLPDDLWEGFRLDQRIYTSANQNKYGWWYQFVFADWYNTIYTNYLKDKRHGHVYDWRSTPPGQHPICRVCGRHPDY
jgi:hypothetical protein